mmetsp:Transcript_5616/g.15088  ORF Transcript_5616/g.15088 Transcript_5616/m.15088 type:complete len:307 (-) Transcript_5616:439-1359(-)
MLLMRSRLTLYPLTRTPTPRPRPRQTPSPSPTPILIPALNHVSSPVKRSFAACLSVFVEWYSCMRSSYLLRTFRSSSARSNRLISPFHGTKLHGAARGMEETGSAPSARSASSIAALEAHGAGPSRRSISSTSPRDSPLPSSSLPVSGQSCSSTMASRLGSWMNDFGDVTFHVGSALCRVMHVCLPSHVPTRHSSNPSWQPRSCAPPPNAEESDAATGSRNASSAAPGDAASRSLAPAAETPQCAAEEPSAEPAGFSSSDHGSSEESRDRPSPASRRVTRPVAHRSFSHKISNPTPSNSTSSSNVT